MSLLTDFYSEAHLGNRFGVRGSMYGPKGHLGQDFNQMPAGTSIPAWRAGTAVARGFSKTLGYFLIVKTDVGFVDYCHMQGSAFKVAGDRVGLGDVVGRLGATGSLAAGVHLHTTLSDSAVLGGQDVHDPLPYIRATISAAGGNIRPISNQEGSDMPIVVRRQATGVTYTVGYGFIRYHQDDRDRLLALYSIHNGSMDEANVIGFNDADFQTMLLDWGLPEVAWSPGLSGLPGPGNGFYGAQWRGPANASGGPAAYPAATVQVPADLAQKIAAQVHIPTTITLEGALK